MPPSPGPDRLPARYEAVELLGQGSFGRVFRATLAGEGAVAVKVLDAGLGAAAEAQWAFAQEYRRLASFDHAGLPRGIEEGRTATGAPFYAMSWAEGETPALERPLDPGRVRQIVAGVAEVLAYLHALGYVHADLKAENLKVSAEGRVTVLDLGLMARAGQARSAVAGTLEYLSPEALRRQPYAPGADLYALGVLAYALRAGRLPFEGPPAVLVEAQLRTEPPALAPEAPDDALDATIRALLAKEPSRRPASARAVLAALGLGEAEAGLQQGLDPEPFLGREELMAAWQEALRAGTGVVALVGAEGAGKSRALQELRLAALVAGRPWAEAACARDEAAPAAPLRAAVAQALAATQHEPAPTVAAWLAGTVPAALEALEPAARRAAFQAAVAEALGAAAQAAGPLAIALDDWHQADPDTRASREAIARATAAAPIVWVLASERGDDLPVPPLGLAPLAPRQVEAYLAARLAAPPPPDLVAELTAASAGNPGLLARLLEDAVAGGALVAGPDGWRYNAHAALGERAEERLAASWQARLAELPVPATALAALLACALPAGWVGQWDLAPALGIEPEQLAAAAAPLLSLGLADERDGSLRLAAPGLRARLLAAVSEDEVGAWARTLALRLAEVGPDGEPAAGLPFDRLVGAARLALDTRDDILAGRLAAAAAGRCLTLAAPAAALALADQALARPGLEPEVRPVLVSARAEACRLLDRVADALSAFQEALELGAGATAAIGLAKCQQLKGDYAAAEASLERARELAAGAGSLTARIALAQARLRLFRNDTSAALTLAAEAADTARAEGQQVLLAQALTLRGFLTIQRDPAQGPRGLAMLDEAIALGEAVGDRLGLLSMYDNLGNARLLVGDLAGAAEAFGTFAARAVELGTETELASARLNQARVAAERGLATGALALAEDARGRAERAGRRLPLGLAMGVAAQAKWRQGELGTVMAELDEALAIARELGNAYMEAHLRLFQLEALVARGDFGRAAVACEDAAAVVGAQHDLARRLAPLRAAIALGCGETTRGYDLALAVTTSPDRAVAQRAWRVVAEAALAAGQDANAAARKARDLALPWASPWHDAASLALLARAAAATGHAAEAARQAREAMRLAAGPDGNPYAAAQAAAVLAGLPGRLAGPGAGTAGLEALRRLVGSLGPEETRGFLAAWDLAALAPYLRQPVAPAGAVVTADFARGVEALVEAADETAIADELLRTALELARAERGYVLAYEEGRLRDVLAHGLDYAAEAEAGYSHTIAEQAMFAAEPLYIQDASTDERWQAAASVLALELRTVVALPLATPDEILGVLYMDRQDPEPLLLDADLALLGSLGRVASHAMVRARRLAAVTAAVALQSARADLAARLLQTAPAARRDTVLAELAAVVGATRGFALAWDGTSWQAVASTSGHGPTDVSAGVADWVWSQQKPLGLYDVAADEDWGSRRSVQALGMRTIWCVPLPEQRGVVYLDTEAAGGDVGPATLAKLAALAAFAWPFTT